MEILELIQRYFPAAKDDDCHQLLVSGTAFPFVGMETIVQQLESLSQRSEGDLGRAWDIIKSDWEAEAARQSGD